MCDIVKYSGFSEQLLLLSGLLIFVGKLINIEIPTDRRLVGNTASGKKHSFYFTCQLREWESMD